MDQIIDVALGILTEHRPISPQANDANPSNDTQRPTELRILIARRPSNTVYGGYWELPGGKIDPGETPVQALVREFHEELGIEIEPGDPLDEVIHTYPHAKVRLYPFFCTRTSGEIQNLAVSEHQWVLPEGLFAFQFPEANIPIIKQMIGILQNATPCAGQATLEGHPKAQNVDI